MTATTNAKGKVTCPVCQQAITSSPVRQYTVMQAARHFCSETRDAQRNARLQTCLTRLWQGSGCSVYVCSSCGFGFGLPYVAGDEEFYAILHEEAHYPAWRWEYQVALRQHHAAPPLCALDIGAGDGAFLRKLGAEWERCAVEGSELTRADLKSRGLQVYATLQEAALGLQGRCHLVTLFQVLEHLQDFATVFQHCRTLLHPQGKLVISVPDGPMMLEQERVTGCPDMPPNHLAKWTPASLTLALCGAGLEVVELEREKASWETFRYALYLKVLAQTARPASLASQIYRIRSRPLRSIGLVFLAIPAALALIFHPGYLCRGGSFALVVKRSD